MNIKTMPPNRLFFHKEHRTPESGRYELNVWAEKQSFYFEKFLVIKWGEA